MWRRTNTCVVIERRHFSLSVLCVKIFAGHKAESGHKRYEWLCRRVPTEKSEHNIGRAECEIWGRGVYMLSFCKCCLQRYRHIKDVSAASPFSFSTWGERWDFILFVCFGGCSSYRSFLFWCKYTCVASLQICELIYEKIMVVISWFCYHIYVCVGNVAVLYKHVILSCYRLFILQSSHQTQPLRIEVLQCSRLYCVLKEQRYRSASTGRLAMAGYGSELTGQKVENIEGSKCLLWQF